MSGLNTIRDGSKRRVRAAAALVATLGADVARLWRRAAVGVLLLVFACTCGACMASPQVNRCREICLEKGGAYIDTVDRSLTFALHATACVCEFPYAEASR